MTGNVYRYCEHLLILMLKTGKSHILRKCNEILMHWVGRHIKVCENWFNQSTGRRVWGVECRNVGIHRK